MMRPGPDNPVGYFEVQSIMELNEQLLAHLGGAWDQPPVLDPGWERDEGLDELRGRAALVLDDVFGPVQERPGLIGWKDPRLSLVLPFWRTVTPIATTIVMVRDPVQVAASLAARKYPVGAPQAAALWLRYVFSATGNDAGHLLLRYDDAFEDLPGTLATVAEHLGLPAPDDDAIVAARAGLDRGLRHYEERSTAGWVNNPLMAIASAVWKGGEVDLGAVSETVATAFARGWLRPPIDSVLLDRARADAVNLRETLRQRNRRLAELESAPADAMADRLQGGGA